MENYKTMLSPQQRFKSGAHNVFNETFNKMALSANDDKRMLV